MYIIDLKNKNKKWFCRICLQCFSSESLLIKHKENCLNINGKPSVKLEKGIIKFENYFKQIPVPFKIYAGFECNLRVLNIRKILTQKNIKIAFLAVWLMIDLQSKLLFIDVKMRLINLLKQFLKSVNIVNK